VKFFYLFIFSFFLLLSPPLVFADQTQANLIVVEKSKRRLVLYSQDKILKEYRVSLGPNPEGAKTQMGDGKTPEGKYTIDYKNPKSAYHLSLRISYPNAEDQKRAQELGVNPGGLIMIHGLPNQLGWIGKLQQYKDWTQGCIAVTNAEIEEIWNLVPVGTAVEIKP